MRLYPLLILLCLAGNISRGQPLALKAGINFQYFEFYSPNDLPFIQAVGPVLAIEKQVHKHFNLGMGIQFGYQARRNYLDLIPLVESNQFQLWTLRAEAKYFPGSQAGGLFFSGVMGLNFYKYGSRIIEQKSGFSQVQQQMQSEKSPGSCAGVGVGGQLFLSEQMFLETQAIFQYWRYVGGDSGLLDLNVSLGYMLRGHSESKRSIDY